MMSVRQHKTDHEAEYVKLRATIEWYLTESMFPYLRWGR